MHYSNVLKRGINFSRVIFYSFFLIIALFIAVEYKLETTKEQNKINSQNNKSETLEIISKDYASLFALIEDTQAKYPSLDLSKDKELLSKIKEYILAGKLVESRKLYLQALRELNQKILNEENKGELFGNITYGKNAVPGRIKIFQGENLVAELDTQPDGSFSYRIAAGEYNVKILINGYNEFTKNFIVNSKVKTELLIPLSKPAASTSSQPKPQVATQNDTSGAYSVQTVNTNRGTFTIHLLRIDLSQYDMKIDTAADGDCINDCPVLNLSSYVSRNGGFAGIHGTYFCPTSYASCAGKTNSFYYKLFGTRINSRINWDNGLGDYLPFISIDQSGSAHYYGSWSSAKNTDMRAGISCRPHLVEGGEVVVTENDLDSDKEKYSKISHGFIGLKGQVVYAGIVLSATVIDSAEAVKALGVENAFNIDGGGTSAMYYNGSYKVGPGRDMPNAIIFSRK